MNLRRAAVLFMVLFSILFWKPSIAEAQGTCNDWNCTTYIYLGGWYKDCVCDDPGSGATGSCGPGEYICNRDGGSCCPIGDVPGGGGDEGGGGASCTETAPTALNFTRDSATSATLSWTPGTPGGSAPYQALWVSTNPDPFVGCAGSSGGTAVCPVRKDSSTVPLDPDQATFFIDNLLAPNTVYYWEVMNFQSSICYQSTLEPNVSSCDLTPSSLSLQISESAPVTSLVAGSSAIANIGFSSGGGGTFSRNPVDDSTGPYGTTVTGIGVGTANMLGTLNFVDFGNISPCFSQPVSITVTPPGAWWQVQDSDISSNGDLNSEVPGGSYFDIAGSGGYPGVPSYTASTDLTGANVSPPGFGWIADSDNLDLKVYDYQFFNNQIPADIIPTPVDSAGLVSALTTQGSPQYGYYWYKFDGVGGLDLSLTSALNLLSRKVILLVDSADFYINAPINLTDGQGFFMVMVGKNSDGNKGNILIDPTVGGGASPNLEGIYEADAQFRTGLSAIQLRVRGSVTGYDKVDLQRDLGIANSNTPAEFFEFAPDQIMLFPARLGVRKINWKEVAP